MAAIKTPLIEMRSTSIVTSGNVTTTTSELQTPRSNQLQEKDDLHRELFLYELYR